MGDEMNKEWYWYHADLIDHTRVFPDHNDFIIWVHLLGWKSGLRPEEIQNGTN